MTARNEDPNYLVWLRQLQARVAKLESGAGTKQNNIRLGDWIMSVTDEGCVMLTSVLSKNATTICDCCSGGGGGTTIHQTITFESVDATVDWVVPATVSSLAVTVFGGNGGGNGITGDRPGAGAQLHGLLSVVPGETLTVQTGGNGGSAGVLGVSNGTGLGGYPDGGAGGTQSTRRGGGGGGSSRIWRGGVLGTPVCIVGGGGGSGEVDAGGLTMIRRGDGGDNVTGGQAGRTITTTGAILTTTSGTGGTTSVGGTLGSTGGTNGTNGANKLGGHGGDGVFIASPTNFQLAGGGGGGGIFGGGGGGKGLGTTTVPTADPIGGQGGGGSSYLGTGWSDVEWTLVTATSSSDSAYQAPIIIIEYDLVVVG